MAGKAVAAINQFDLYSCFPCAVLLAAETLGIDWHKTPCTVTGGLPFFGGAGNNYSMHAIATMAERLRASPGDYGLVPPRPAERRVGKGCVSSGRSGGLAYT